MEPSPGPAVAAGPLASLTSCRSSPRQPPPAFVTPLHDPFLDDRDGPRDECGVFGVYAPGREVARLAYFALYALQHRGQESAGIAAAQAGPIMTVRGLGLVGQGVHEEKPPALQGEVGIGHGRPPATGPAAGGEPPP